MHCRLHALFYFILERYIVFCAVLYMTVILILPLHFIQVCGQLHIGKLYLILPIILKWMV